MTDNELRELARAFCVAVVKAETPEELPVRRLAQRQAARSRLRRDRTRGIKALPLAMIADGGA